MCVTRKTGFGCCDFLLTNKQRRMCFVFIVLYKVALIFLSSSVDHLSPRLSAIRTRSSYDEQHKQQPKKSIKRCFLLLAPYTNLDPSIPRFFCVFFTHSFFQCNHKGRSNKIKVHWFDFIKVMSCS